MNEVVKFLSENPVQYLATVGRDGKAKCANIPTLAVIPANPNLSGDKKHKRKAGKT